jgi:hypothetical protein
MARSPKHPGLQQKFEQALLDVLSGGKPLKAREILASTGKVQTKFGITTEELDDLNNNFANYAARAKDAGVIVSGGPWGGYELPGTRGGAARSAPPVSEAKPLSYSGAQPSEAPSEFEPVAAPRRQHWESFLHLPLTVALSRQFKSRVVSLRNVTDNVRWGNPDMLMLRSSPLARVEERDSALEPDVFHLVDVTPECILASIEVKGLARDRKELFTAIAETAANSRWANEAWLAFVYWEKADQGLDEDVVSLARSVEVGLLEVQVSGDCDKPVLQTTIHHAAPTMPTLRIGELTAERVNVLLTAQSLLKEWQSGLESGQTTFIDVPFAQQKARLLIQQALDNLRTQKGFIGDDSLLELLAPLRANPEDADYVASILGATLRSAAIAGEVDTEADLTAVVGDAAGSLVWTKAEAFRRDLSAFGRTFLSRKA